MRVHVETKVAGWEVFPEGWPRRAFDLIANSWPDVRISSRDEAEEDISGKLHTALLERFYAADKEWYPTLEQPCVDGHGKYFGFTDLRFDIFVKPPQRCVFVVENKRLNVAKAESKYAVRYVEEGITRFITGKYSPRLSCGGMVGFVMDGNCPLARKHIASAIAARRVLLAMSPDGVLEEDADLPCSPDTGRTEHTRNGTPFTMKHMLLPEFAAIEKIGLATELLTVACDARSLPTWKDVSLAERFLLFHKRFPLRLVSKRENLSDLRRSRESEATP